MAKLKSALLS